MTVLFALEATVASSSRVLQRSYGSNKRQPSPRLELLSKIGITSTYSGIVRRLATRSANIMRQQGRSQAVHLGQREGPSNDFPRHILTSTFEKNQARVRLVCALAFVCEAGATEGEPA